jgi:hypothetical protein
MKQASVKIERLGDLIGRARKLARLADAGKLILESFVISFRIKWARLEEQSETDHSCTAWSPAKPMPIRLSSWCLGS